MRICVFQWDRRSVAGAVALAASLLQAACAAPPPNKPPPNNNDGRGLYQQIRDEIGDATCSANDQCKTIAVGHKSCGGPDTYLAWSTKDSDGKTLRGLVEAYNEKQRKEDERPGRVSNCMLVTDPGARCEAGRCVPAGRGPAVM